MPSSIPQDRRAPKANDQINSSKGQPRMKPATANARTYNFGKQAHIVPRYRKDTTGMAHFLGLGFGLFRV